MFPAPCSFREFSPDRFFYRTAYVSRHGIIARLTPRRSGLRLFKPVHLVLLSQSIDCIHRLAFRSGGANDYVAFFSYEKGKTAPKPASRIALALDADLSSLDDQYDHEIAVNLTVNDLSILMARVQQSVDPLDRGGLPRICSPPQSK
jgi:hypothetical protein